MSKTKVKTEQKMVHYWEDYWLLPACEGKKTIHQTSDRVYVTCPVCLTFLGKGEENEKIDNQT